MSEEFSAEVYAFPESKHHRNRRRLGVWIGIAVTAVVILASIMAILYFSPVLATKRITTTGNHLLKEETVVEKLGELTDKPLPQITDGEVATILADESAISSSRVQVELPDTLIVHLIEYDPVVIVKTGSKSAKFELYNSLGQSIKALDGAKEAESFKLPIIDSKQATEDPAVFETITKVLGEVDGSLRSQMSSAEAKTVDSVILKLKDGRQIFWGNAENNGNKIAVLNALMKSEADRKKRAADGGSDDYTPAKVFDVSTPDQPVLR